MVSTCRRNGSRRIAATWCGRNGRITGGWEQDRRKSTFTAVADAVARSEPVTMLASAGQWERARAVCARSITVVEMTTDDAWARDIGPTFVVNRARGERRGVDWIFNAWGGLDGGLYDPWANDDLVAAKVCELEGVSRYRAPLVLEGGSIHVDGAGDVHHDRRMPLEPQPEPGPQQEGDRSASSRPTWGSRR